MALLARLASGHDALTRVGFELAKLCLLGIVVAYSTEVVSRYFFGSPTWWVEETVSYLLCVGCFLAMPHVSRERGHVAMSLVVQGLAARPAQIWERGTFVAAALTCLAVAAMSLDENVRQIVNNINVVQVGSVPKALITVWITYGFGSSAVHFLRLAFGPAPEPASGMAVQ